MAGAAGVTRKGFLAVAAATVLAALSGCGTTPSGSWTKENTWTPGQGGPGDTPHIYDVAEQRKVEDGDAYSVHGWRSYSYVAAREADVTPDALKDWYYGWVRVSSNGFHVIEFVDGGGADGHSAGVYATLGHVYAGATLNVRHAGEYWGYDLVSYEQELVPDGSGGLVLAS